MNSALKNIILGVIIISTLSSCASIVGGSTYTAHVQVKNNPKAQIYRNGIFIGQGNAITEIKRRTANQVHFVLKDANYEDQAISYTDRTFRGWSFAGTSFLSFYYLPLGILIDGASGAWWKPNVLEPGIRKYDFDNFQYLLTYNAKPIKKQEKVVVLKEQEKTVNNDFRTTEEKLRDLKKMRDEGVVDDEEYKLLKLRVLGIEREMSDAIASDSTSAVDTSSKVIEPIKEEIEVSEEKTIAKEEVKTVEPEKVAEPEVAQEKQPEPKLTPEEQEKLNDLDKMLGLGIISQQEYDEMKQKLVDKE